MTGEATIAGLSGVALDVAEGALVFEQRNRTAIDAHWSRLAAANPRLWNGPFFLFEDVRLDSGVLKATARRTDFATFLYWRDHGRPEAVVHITGTSLPVTADGALLAVRMAAHTANAGAVYFPAGSFDAADIVDGRFDVTGNIARELEEETGLAFAIEQAEAGLHAVWVRGAWHIARRNRLAGDFDTCLDLIDRHKAEGGDDEIETAVAVRGSEDLHLLNPHARALAEWHFANPRFSASGER